MGIRGLRGVTKWGEPSIEAFVRQRWLALPFPARHAFVDAATAVPLSRWVEAAAAMTDDERYRFYSVLLVIESTRLLRRNRRDSTPLVEADIRAFARAARRLWPALSAEAAERDFAAVYKLRRAVGARRVQQIARERDWRAAEAGRRAAERERRAREARDAEHERRVEAGVMRACLAIAARRRG